MNYKSTSHFLHFIMTLLFFPWIVIWVWRYVSNDSHNKQVDRMMMLMAGGGSKRQETNLTVTVVK